MKTPGRVQTKGNNSSSEKSRRSPLGGISPTFPIGTFVRPFAIPPTAAPQEETTVEDTDAEQEAEKEAKSATATWTKEMDALVGEIGMVVGGADKKHYDQATVAFRDKPSGVFVSFQFASKWLQPVAVTVVSEPQRRLFALYFSNEIRSAIESTLTRIESLSCDSFFGTAGSFVRVVAKNGGADWPEHQRPTNGLYGIVLSGLAEMFRKQNSTLVFFVEPVFWRYKILDSDLEPATETEVPPSLLALRNHVCKAATDVARDRFETSMREHHEKTHKALEEIDSRVDSLSKRLETIEQRIVYLNVAQTGAPLLAIKDK